MATEAQIVKVKQSFENNERLTVLDALKRGMGSELRSTVCKIRKRFGLNIVSKRVPGECYNEYYLANE
jgi:hypothetical protein